jgi:DNA-binding CsgD family transcriptional regulator
MNNLLLLRATRRVAACLDGLVQDKPCDALGDVLPFIDTVRRMFPQWVIQTCVHRHPETRFISENCQDVFGYTAERLLQQNYLLMLFSYIHEDDITELQQCYLFIDQLLKEGDFNEPEELRFVFHYRVRHQNGTYVSLYDEKASLKVNNALTMYYSLFRDNGPDRIFTGVKVEVYAGGMQIRKVASFSPSNHQLTLSSREGDILHLMRRGLTNKEIACLLKISPNTARNIRQKVFKRYRVNNTVELLNKTVAII